MATAFRLRLRADNVWVPAHPEVEWYISQPNDDSITSYGQLRTSFWDAIAMGFPGQFMLDDAVSTEDAKQWKFAVVDKRTARAIARGFLWQGARFSLSLEAQLRYGNMLSLAMLNAIYPLGYPIQFNSLDDLATCTLTNETDVVLFCSAAAAYVRDQIDGGTQLKARVRAATSLADVDAIIDTREV